MGRKSVLYLNGKPIGDGHPVYLVAEAGACHVGMESAKQLVDIAIDAGFDAVKFQKVNLDKINPDEMFGEHRLYDILKQRELTNKEWIELEGYCRDKIFMFWTVVDKVSEHRKSYKIASRWIKDLDLIKNVSQHCDVIQIDTGNATMHDILKAISVTDIHCKVIIHHCPKGYPANPENEKLSTIKDIKSMFSCLVAYSSHRGDFDLDLVALGMGVNLIEKPIKEFNCKSISPEAEYALEPYMAIAYVTTIRNAEKAL